MQFFTGDIPTESLLNKQNNLRQLDHCDSRALWSGNIDAPGFIPAGSTLASRIEDEVFVSPRSVPRCI